MNYALLAQIVLNTMFILGLLGILKKYKLWFNPLRTWLVAVFISLTTLNTFAIYFPTPYNPWSYIVAKLVLTAFVMEVYFDLHGRIIRGYIYAQGKFRRRYESRSSNVRTPSDQPELR